MNVASTVLAVLLAIMFLILGMAKILALAPMRKLAAEVGFSTRAYQRIGVLLIAGAAGLLIGPVEPLLGDLAGAGLLVLLACAVAIHVRNGHAPPKFAPAAVSFLLVAGYLAVHLAAA